MLDFYFYTTEIFIIRSTVFDLYIFTVFRFVNLCGDMVKSCGCTYITFKRRIERMLSIFLKRSRFSVCIFVYFGRDETRRSYKKVVSLMLLIFL